MRAAVVQYDVAPRLFPWRRLLLIALALVLALLLTGLRRAEDLPMGHPPLPFRAAVAAPFGRSVPADLEVHTVCRPVRGIVRYDGAWWAATGGALVRLACNAGEHPIRYTRADGLPDNDVRALAVADGAMYVGTAEGGLCVVRDRQLRRWTAPDPAWMRIAALLPRPNGGVYVGTAGGLLEFDGRHWRICRGGGPGAVEAAVLCVADWDGRVAVGTAEGLFVETEGGFARLGAGAGLPEGRIAALAAYDDALVAAAQDGVYLVSDALRARRISETVNATAVSVVSGEIWIARADGRLERRAGRTEPIRAGRVHSIAHTPDGPVAATDRGLFAVAHGADGWNRWRDLPSAPLSSNHVTALAQDGSGRLWVGNGNGGVDVVATANRGESPQRIRHLRGPHGAPVRWIARDDASGEMWISTPRGLWTATEDGTIGVRRGGPALAAAGMVPVTGELGRRAAPTTTLLRAWLTDPWFETGRITAAARLGALLAFGTRDGVELVEEGAGTRPRPGPRRPGRARWVTALLPVGEQLYVGTHRNGVGRFDPSAGWLDLPGAGTSFGVSPNGLAHDGKRLVVGTPDRGAMILDETRGWVRIDRELPSSRVEAVLATDDGLWFGTDRGLACAAGRGETPVEAASATAAGG